MVRGTTSIGRTRRTPRVEWHTGGGFYKDLYFFGRKVYVSINIGLLRRGKCGSCGK